ncbi:MAG: phosphoribosylanthranilate isomerase [Phycisphaeraceae bacterium]|nr:phosphoribosylanthranilate isomerase [Phycisphaeraceae bacterium]
MKASHRTRIKICGIADAATLAAAVDAGADAVGFVLAEGSPRTLDPGAARDLLARVPPLVTPVLVLRNTPLERLRPFLAPAGARAVFQAHGDEDEAFMAQLPPPRIRAIRYDDDDAWQRWRRSPAAEMVLIDGPVPGSGRPFDHATFNARTAGDRPRGADDRTHPIILAGGLTAANVGEAIRRIRPYAVDVSSGVESAPGRKDPGLIARFCAEVRAADASTVART